MTQQIHPSESCDRPMQEESASPELPGRQLQKVAGDESYPDTIALPQAIKKKRFDRVLARSFS